MNIVIVGAGKVGETLCRDLANEGRDIYLIEIDEDKIDKTMEIADIVGIVGNGAAYDIQKEANVDQADIFIAVTDSDELNIIACIMAKKIGAKYTIARVRSPEYSQNMEFVRRDLGISMMVNPEKESAKRILGILKYPSASNVESFMDDQVKIAEFEIEKNSALIDKALKDIDTKEDRVLICIVDRDGEITIPNGDFVLKEKDKIHVTGNHSSMRNFIDKYNYEHKKIDSCLIVGGGQISYYLIQELLKKKIKTKLIEVDEERARFFSSEFPKLVVVKADGTDHGILKEQRIASYDALVAATGIDEENIILSMFGQSEGVDKSITKINRDLLYPIAEKMKLDSIITPKKVIADLIIKFVRSLVKNKSSELLGLHRLLNGQVEAIHFYMDKDSEAINKPLKDLELKEKTLIACIKRNNQIIYPGGNDCIKKGDDILVITRIPKIEEFDDILV